MVKNNQDELSNKLIFIQQMQNNYFQYNDVDLIDSTYKTNKYIYPLLILSNSDNQGKNIIFAIAFINNETQATHKWVLTTFSNFMSLFDPIFIINDQDFAIISAIKEVFPNRTHYLCKCLMKKISLNIWSII